MIGLLGLSLLSMEAAPAEVWLGRAEKEIAALPAETPKEFMLVQPQELAVQLYLTTPSNERRKFASSMIDRAVKRYLDHTDSAEHLQGIYSGGALEYATVGDFDNARRLLDLADQAGRAKPTAEPWAQMFNGSGERAEAFLLMGDNAAFYKMKLPAPSVGVMADDLRSMGRLEEAKIADGTMKSAMDIFKDPSAKPAVDTGMDRVEKARDLAEAGNYDQAFKVAATADDLPADKDGFRKDPGWYSFDAYASIARMAVRAGDLPHFAQAKTQAIELLKKYPSTNFSELNNFTDQCAKAKDHDAFEIAAQAEQVQMQRSERPTDRAYPWAHLAALYAEMGDNANYSATAERAEKEALAQLKDFIVHEDKKRDQLRHVAVDYLWIAAARARMGDVAGVNRDADLSSQVTTLDGGYWDEEWAEVIHGYVAAGLVDQAASALPFAKWEDYGTLHVDVATALAHMGRFDDAWKLAGQTATLGRIRLDYRLAVLEMQTHHETEAAARVDGLKSPYEKAVVELAIAQAMTGKPYTGYFRVFAEKRS
jgi:hypothetical protein